MKSTKLFLLVVLFLASCGAPATSAPEITATFTPEPTSTQTLVPTATATPAPTQVGGGSGRLIFTYSKDDFIKSFPDLKGETNVFVANIDGTNSTPITNGLEGFNYLKDVSPDGTKVLIASASDLKSKDSILYLVNLNSLDTEPVKLAEGLPNYYGGNSSAKWVDDSKIVYVGKGEAGFGIYSITTDGSNPINIYKYNNDSVTNKPFEILIIDNTRIYWDAQSTTQLGGNRVNNKYYISWTSLDGTEQGKLEFNGEQIFFEDVFGPNLVFSPDGTKIAWVEKATPESGPPYHNYIHIASISDINNPYTVEPEPLTGSLVLKWYPDGSKILVFDLGSVSNFFGKQADTTSDLYGIYEVSTTPNVPIKNYGLDTEKMILIKEISGGVNYAYTNLYDISPDGRQIICALYELDTDGNFVGKLNFLNLETFTFSESSEFSFTNGAVGGVHWIP